MRRAQMLMPVPGVEQMDDERCDRDHREDDHDHDQGVHAIPAPFDAQADTSGSPGAVRLQATPPTGTLDWSNPPFAKWFADGKLNVA
ncbi:acetyl-coenzyme A synthetase N-terminal domain-containing protein, partial [Streptomyces sp. NPDC053720]|uniref:acetyl-coenzyme A synthetase N-terminal domain-containing protein n=1 Tax=Streptomyces sp. NPDC053720 TaxID=3154855 RepID=UPI00342599F8